MASYFLMLFIIVVLCSIAERSNNKQSVSLYIIQRDGTVVKNLSLFMVILVMAFLAGARYHVGTDYKAYEGLFYSYQNKLLSIETLFDEPVAIILAKFAHFIGGDVHTFFMLSSMLTIVPVLASTYKETYDYRFVTLLLVFTGWWHGTFNGMRQFLAITVIYCGRHFIKNGDFIKYFGIVMLAYLCHKSAIVFIVLYFFPSKKFKIHRLLLVIILSIALSRSTALLFSIVGFLKNSEFIADEYATASVHSLRIAVGCVPAIVAVYEALTKELDEDQIFYMYMLVSNATFRLMTSNSAYLARIAAYMGVFVPIGLSKILEAEEVNNKRSIKKVAIILYFFYWFVEVSKSKTLSEYEWYLGR